MKQKFAELAFRVDTLRAIETANNIIREYAAQGYRLTLRQLYYQHVARGLLENTERNYKNLGEMVSRARLAGLVDWDAIEDRTRNLRGLSHWNSPSDIIYSAYRSFHIDRWENQPNRVECWVEKDALVGILERVCQQYDVNYFACRGYVSQSEMYEAGKRIAKYIEGGQTVHVLHLGDHDPSGIDMTRDNRERLEMFLGQMGVEVNRLALNWEQVQLYNPPPNPAKTTDSRFDSYADLFGNESWELDALEPQVIVDLIEEHILALLDRDLWQEKEEEEEEHKKLLRRAAKQWDSVARFLS